MNSISPPRHRHAPVQAWAKHSGKIVDGDELPPVAAEAATQRKAGRGWFVLSVLLLGLLSTGCARLTQTLTTTIVTTNGVIETRTSKATGWALLDSKNSLEKLRVSNGKTHSIGLSGLEQESTTTNAAATLDAVTRLLQTVK